MVFRPVEELGRPGDRLTQLTLRVDDGTCFRSRTSPLWFSRGAGRTDCGWCVGASLSALHSERVRESSQSTLSCSCRCFVCDRICSKSVETRPHFWWWSDPVTIHPLWQPKRQTSAH